MKYAKIWCDNTTTTSVVIDWVDNNFQDGVYSLFSPATMNKSDYIVELRRLYVSDDYLRRRTNLNVFICCPNEEDLAQIVLRFGTEVIDFNYPERTRFLVYC